ncbi:TetR family transcriptional regulator [Embleya scabrispora]|uniref:TetR family transcriptional regulator n=1 Tax=Embleya scabrispora TaxID=159449 RepID=A0A1T3NID9_9ACTN|nr:TetR/AcrR family transcriptional regulator [Embleya scabrispora]OPC76594.1 TetR family transcriptional regulator [Embleya scabrispora]
MKAAAREIARKGVRGLRVEELAAEAGVSTGLIYYHFKDRDGILRATLGFISDRAGAYTSERVAESGADTPRKVLEQTLLLEFQDIPEVRENSTAWGELRASAMFDDTLRGSLADAVELWSEEIAALIGQAVPDATVAAAHAAAQRMTSLVEGLSGRWLSGCLALESARELLLAGIDVELTYVGG